MRMEKLNDVPGIKIGVLVNAKNNKGRIRQAMLKDLAILARKATPEKLAVVFTDSVLDATLINLCEVAGYTTCFIGEGLPDSDMSIEGTVEDLLESVQYALYYTYLSDNEDKQMDKLSAQEGLLYTVVEIEPDTDKKVEDKPTVPPSKIKLLKQPDLKQKNPYTDFRHEDSWEETPIGDAMPKEAPPQLESYHKGYN